jgi:hypothetical protein
MNDQKDTIVPISLMNRRLGLSEPNQTMALQKREPLLLAQSSEHREGRSIINREFDLVHRR